MPALTPPFVEGHFPAAVLAECWRKAIAEDELPDDERDFLVELTSAELRVALGAHDFALATEPRFGNQTLESLAVLAEREDVPLYVGWWRGAPLVLLPVAENTRAFLETATEIPFGESARVTVAGRQALWLSWNY